MAQSVVVRLLLQQDIVGPHQLRVQPVQHAVFLHVDVRDVRQHACGRCRGHEELEAVLQLSCFLLQTREVQGAEAGEMKEKLEWVLRWILRNGF